MMQERKLQGRQFQLLIGILLAIFLLTYFKAPLSGQSVGGPCEGCEAIFEYGGKELSPVDTLPEFESHKNKMLITGTVYQQDGTTPVANVIIYAYHTNEKGIYPTRGDERGWARRHGYIRGWTKTDNQGHYSFYTFKPESYPSRTEAAHVHLTVKEPGINAYWIDAIEFEGDPLLTEKKKQAKRKRGGSGIVSLSHTPNGYLLCERDIILGENIPGY